MGSEDAISALVSEVEQLKGILDTTPTAGFLTQLNELPDADDSTAYMERLQFQDSRLELQAQLQSWEGKTRKQRQALLEYIDQLRLRDDETGMSVRASNFTQAVEQMAHKDRSLRREHVPVMDAIESLLAVVSDPNLRDELLEVQRLDEVLAKQSNRQTLCENTVSDISLDAAGSRKHPALGETSTFLTEAGKESVATRPTVLEGSLGPRDEIGVAVQMSCDGLSRTECLSVRDEARWQALLNESSEHAWMDTRQASVPDRSTDDRPRQEQGVYLTDEATARLQNINDCLLRLHNESNFSSHVNEILGAGTGLSLETRHADLDASSGDTDLQGIQRRLAELQARPSSEPPSAQEALLLQNLIKQLR